MITISYTCTDAGWQLTLFENGKHRKSYITSDWEKLCQTAQRWKEAAQYLAQLN